MSEPSRTASIEEQQQLNAAAQVFIAAVLDVVRQTYGAERVESWPEEARNAAATTTAVQALLHPEAYATERLNLDFSAYSLGMALGSESGAIPDHQVGQMLAQFSIGFGTGRAERVIAAAGMTTAGRA